MVWPKILKINNNTSENKTHHFRLWLWGRSRVYHGALCCLDHTTWGPSSRPTMAEPIALSQSIFIRPLRASAEAQDNSHTSVSGHKGEEKASFLPLSQRFCSAKQCSFQNEVASILPGTDNESQHPCEPTPGLFRKLSNYKSSPSAQLPPGTSGH